MGNIQEIIQLNQDLKNSKDIVVVHLGATIYTTQMNNSQTYINIVDMQEYLNNIDTYQAQKAEFDKAFNEKVKSIYQISTTNSTTSNTTTTTN